MHDPTHATDVQEGRRLGGTRRKRETILAGAFDYSGLSSVEDIRRVLEVAVLDALALDNSPARTRILVAVAHEASALLRTGDIEDRLLLIEQALLRPNPAASSPDPGPWDDDPDNPTVSS